jgi:PEP-CTERM motif
MNLKTTLAVAATGLFLAAGQASAETITFETLAVGTTLSNQFAGVTFAPSPFSGPGSSTSGEDWASNTDMTIVDSAGADVGGLGVPSLVSGNILRSFAGWLNEDGDPSFRISFAAPINSFAATFAGVTTGADVTMWAFNGATQVGLISGITTGQFTLSLASANITSVIIRPGSFNDWVGVDNITFTPAAVVPEASTYAMMGLGLALLAFKRRKA